MTDYFDDEAVQVSPATFSAFGIAIASRFGKASEIAEMLDFAEEAYLAGVAEHVKSAFYDSKANLCFFVLDERCQAGDDIAQGVRQAAEESISQFELFGIVGHGGRCNKDSKYYASDWVSERYKPRGDSSA